MPDHIKAFILLDGVRLALEKSQWYLTTFLTNPPEDMSQEAIDKLKETYDETRRFLEDLHSLLDD